MVLDPGRFALGLTGSSGGSTTSTSPLVQRRSPGAPRRLRRPEEALHEREARGHRGRRRHQVRSRSGRHRPRRARQGHRGRRQGLGQRASASPVSPAQIAQCVQSLQQYVKSATADLWVGQDDKQLHRFATTIDGKTDDSTKASSGIDGFNITLDVSATPTSTRRRSRLPSSPAPISQLEQDLGGLLGGLAATGRTASRIWLTLGSGAPATSGRSSRRDVAQGVGPLKITHRARARCACHIFIHAPRCRVRRPAAAAGTLVSAWSPTRAGSPTARSTSSPQRGVRLRSAGSGRASPVVRRRRPPPTRRR